MKEDKKKVVIFGASGYIGTNLISIMHRNVDIIAVYRKKSDDFGEYDDVTYICLEDNKDICSIIRGSSGIINLAWKKVPREGDSLKYYNECLEFAEEILQNAYFCGIKNILQVSSRCVYGSENEIPFSEKQAPHPINLYGVSKVALEELGEFYNRKYGMCIKTVRLSQVYGGKKYDFGVISKYINCILNNEPLCVFGSGKNKRDYVYIKDVCQAIFKLFDKAESKGIYNLGGDSMISYNQLVTTFQELLRKDYKIVRKNLNYEDLDCALDISKISELTGYVPQYSIKDGIAEIFEEAKETNK